MSTVDSTSPVIIQNNLDKPVKIQTFEPKYQSTINNVIDNGMLQQNQDPQPTYDSRQLISTVEQNFLSQNDSSDSAVSEDNIEKKNDYSSVETKVTSEPKYSIKVDKPKNFEKKYNKNGLRSQSLDTYNKLIKTKDLNLDESEDSDHSNHLQVDNNRTQYDISFESSVESINATIEENITKLKNDVTKKLSAQISHLKDQNDTSINIQRNTNEKVSNIEKENKALHDQIKKSNQKEYERKKITIIFFFSSFLACFIWILTVVVFKSLKAPFLPKYMERKIHQIFVGLSFGLFLESTWTSGDIVEAALFLKYKESDKKCKNTSTRCCYIGGWLFFFIILITNYFGFF